VLPDLKRLYCFLNSKTERMPIMDRELDIVQLQRELKIVLFKGDKCPTAGDANG